MISPTDAGLPYPEWVPGQLDAICQALTSDAKYIIIEAPTGSGKSAIAAAVGRMWGSYPVQVLTSTKQLQDQYSDAFQMFKLMGRNNFQCLIEPVTADRAICTIGSDCEFKKPEKTPFMDGESPPECPYYNQSYRGRKSQEAVFNYAYWLAMQNYAGWPQAGLLICDEAHLLEDEIRRFSSLSLNVRHVAVLNHVGLPISWPTFELDMIGWMEWAEEYWECIQREYDNLPQNPNSSLERTWHAAVKGVYDCISGLRQDSMDPENWVAQEQVWGVRFLPVWVQGLAQKVVFSHAQRTILMSATILDKEMFCAQLGIPPADAEFIQVPSSFKPTSRPLHILPGIRVRANSPDSLRALVYEVDQILKKHPEQQGIIHTGSYKIARYLCEHSRLRRRLVTHTSGDRSVVIRRFRAGTPGCVLVSPSATTGLDLPYDLCRFQIIAKIPFPDQGDPQVARRMKEIAPGVPNPKGQSWYNWTTLCNVIQAYGRGMRAADDSCETYLLDANWKWFRHAVDAMIPAWVREAIRVQKRTDTLEDLWSQI